jgi:hypothetical protein
LTNFCDPPTKSSLRRPLESAQYTSIAFGARCREAGVQPSMGSVGDAYDNAMAESFFATLECELLDRRRFKTQAEARIAVFTFIEGFYNPRRRHSGIGYLSPVAYEKKLLDPAARDPAIVLTPVEARPGDGEIGGPPRCRPASTAARHDGHRIAQAGTKRSSRPNKKITR